MSENSSKKIPKISLQLGSPDAALSLLAALLGVLAAWMLWSGISQWRAQSAGETVLAERDRAVQQVSQVMTQTKKRIVDAAADPAVAAAASAAAPDAATLQTAFAAAAKGAQEAIVFPADLQPAYAALPATGYGKLAAVEAAIASGKPQVRVARVGKANALIAATPLPAGQVALAAYPLQPLQKALEGTKPGSGYLSLRQGAATVAEKGDQALADSAESQASKVGGTDLRVAAAMPVIAPGPFGLGGIASLIAGALLLALAVLALVWPKLRGRSAVADEEAEAPTLEQAVIMDASAAPPPVVPDSVPLAAAGNAAALALADDEGAQANVPLTEVPAVDAGIFRAYDIRGVVGQTLNTDVAYAIGQAIGSLMHEKGLKRIVVGRDGRLSGPELAGALVEGLRSTGRDVTDIGLAPTPLVYFAAAQEEGGSCVAVTGSHNPPDYNGFKIVVGSETLSGATITDLYQRIVTGRLHRAAQPGGLETRQMAPDYVLRVASDIQLARPLKVVVDAGNGAAGELGPRVLEAIGAEVIPLFCEIDGNFPNHHPDPSEPHNLEDLRRNVEEHGADIGLAFDGDGDRLGVITPAGANIFPDRLLMLFAADVLDRQPGAVIVYDVKCTGALMPFILRHGGSPLMWKTGHSLIKAKMRETEAELAGEMSGHFFFKERWFGFDDGIYSAARLLEILAAREEDVDTVFAEIPEGISTPELKIPTENPHAFIERFVAMGEFDGGRATTIDGLRADWPDGWGLVRASNTTPILVLRFEADDAAALARIQDVFRARLLDIDPGLSIPF